MSRAFRSVFEADLSDTYLNQWSEFAEWREFSLVSQSKTYNIKVILVVWNSDMLKQLNPVIMYGQLLVGDASFLTWKRDWPQRPRRNQVIWTPRDIPWTVMSCQEIQQVCYRVTLQ